MSVEAQFTCPLNSMVSPSQREFVDEQERTLKGVSRAVVVREGLDVLMLLDAAGVPQGQRLAHVMRLLDSGGHPA